MTGSRMYSGSREYEDSVQVVLVHWRTGRSRQVVVWRQQPRIKPCELEILVSEEVVVLSITSLSSLIKAMSVKL